MTPAMIAATPKAARGGSVNVTPLLLLPELEPEPEPVDVDVLLWDEPDAVEVAVTGF